MNAAKSFSIRWVFWVLGYLMRDLQFGPGRDAGFAIPVVNQRNVAIHP
jgi:hypothetical protein